MMRAPLSAATANLSRHASTENFFKVSMLSFEIPTTVAPIALNFGVASAKLCASTVHPLVKAFGKKYNTTGPFFKVSDRENLNATPPSAASVVKSGVGAPTASAARAEVLTHTSTNEAHIDMQWFCNFIKLLQISVVKHKLSAPIQRAIHTPSWFESA